MGKDKRNYTIGFDIGGTKILACLVDDRFRVISEIKSKTKPEKGQRTFLRTLVDSVHYLLRDAKIGTGDVLGLGVGCPGFIDWDKGTILESANIPFLKNFPLAKKLARLTGIPVTLGNDVQTGLYGEHQLGAAKGYANVIGIFMGTGIGGALILNGQPYRGASGSAGEVGHVQVDPLGPSCGCGRNGCLEALAGRLAISAEAAIAAARQKAPHLDHTAGTDIRNIKSGALAKAIRAGDRALADILRAKARRVGVLMANLVNILNPHMIILGGGVVEAMPALIVKEAEKTMRAYAIATSARHVKVAAAKLGDHAVAVGAAKRAADLFGKKRVKEPWRNN